MIATNDELALVKTISIVFFTTTNIEIYFSSLGVGSVVLLSYDYGPLRIGQSQSVLLLFSQSDYLF